jgi:hypothetical protein
MAASRSNLVPSRLVVQRLINGDRRAREFALPMPSRATRSLQ